VYEPFITPKTMSKRLDVINSSFKYTSGFFIIPTIWNLYQSKNAEGISFVHIFFFTPWGVWNLYYFRKMNQPLSMIANIFLVIMNLIWLILVINYKK
jgi:uncharacterized protein with PQ loop repeat